MKRKANRRDFLKSTAMAGAGLVIGHSRSAVTYAANEKANIGIVGVSGRGSWFVGCMPRMSNVVAMCDVNDYRAKRAYADHPKAKKFKDFRKMLDAMGGDIDGITVATPDNTHAVITAAAMRAGKGVLCEKPLTHNVYEARQMRLLARQFKVPTQMGNQGTASRAFRRAVDLIWAGVLGNVREVHAWNTGGGAGERPIPTEEHKLPETLDWNLWLGPAKYRPYNSRWAQWHTWRDFATGNLGNWASHTMNVVFKGLRIDDLFEKTEGKSDSRIKLQAKVSGIHNATFPRWEKIKFHVPARGELPPVTINWYNGGGRAPCPREEIEEKLERKLDWGDAGEKRWADHAGCLLIGDKGMLHSNGHNTEMTLLPSKKFAGFEDPEPTLLRSRGHEREWLDAVQGGPAAMSNFNYSGPLAEFLLLGNIATRFEGPIEFDPVAMKIVNNSSADRLIKRDYRDGWSL